MCFSDAGNTNKNMTQTNTLPTTMENSTMRKSMMATILGAFGMAASAGIPAHALSSPGLVVDETASSTSRATGNTVARAKREAIKAKNRKRNRAAHRG
jgi:hypothetical protein